MYTYMCVPVHRRTELGGASTRGLRHIVLITSPISKETHPFPSCCLPPVKDAFDSITTARADIPAVQVGLKEEKRCYQKHSKIQPAGWPVATEAVLSLKGQCSLKPATPPVSTIAQQQFSALFSFMYEALFTVKSYKDTAKCSSQDSQFVQVVGAEFFKHVSCRKVFTERKCLPS